MHRRGAGYFVSRGRRARAFAPAHVTGIFRPALSARDPRARGSLGAGIVLEVGVTAEAEVDPAGPDRIRLTSDARRPLPISEEVARRLFPPGIGTLRVRLAHDLPIGQGFGLSAAGATATALAVAAVGGRSRAVAIQTAHLADLFGGGGLGGVAAIVGGGGLEFRVRPGIPPWGAVEHRALAGPILVGVVGRPIPSPRILRGRAALGRLARAAGDLPELLRRPSAAAFFRASADFTDRAGLTSPALERVLRALRNRGADAAQAMFGRAFFARPTDARSRAAVLGWLQEAHLPVLELRAAASGARLLEDPRAAKAIVLSRGPSPPRP